jgi:hypothetical protein
MNKVDEFKSFVKEHPVLIRYIKNKEMTWQKFYEIYDLYGEDESVWNEYLTVRQEKKETISSNTNHFEDFINMAKNIDMDKVQDGLTSLQKTLSLFGDLFINKDGNVNTNSYNPRPLYRKFED